MPLIDFILNIDKHIESMANAFGPWTYVILFLVIFVETGAIIMPFLPGDSLLFAAGALAANPNVQLNSLVFWALFIVAAVLGDSLNFWLAKTVGGRLLQHKLFSRFIKQEHIAEAEAFYEKRGASAIIVGRFLPIVRTFVPFVAGISGFPFKKFFPLTVLAAVIWSSLAVGAGHLFGNIPFVKDHFSAIILGVAFVTLLPTIISVVRTALKSKKA